LALVRARVLVAIGFVVAGRLRPFRTVVHLVLLSLSGSWCVGHIITGTPGGRAGIASGTPGRWALAIVASSRGGCIWLNSGTPGHWAVEVGVFPGLFVVCRCRMSRIARSAASCTSLGVV
jgi:hypothetical protein